VAVGIGLLVSSPALFRLLGMIDRNPIEPPPYLEGVSQQLLRMSRQFAAKRELSLLLVVASAAGLVLLGRRGAQQRVIAIVLGTAGITMVTALLIATTRRPVHGARYLTAGLPCLWIGLAVLSVWGMTQHRRVIRVAAGTLLAAQVIWQAYRCTNAMAINGTHLYADNLARAIATVKQSAQPSDQVVYIPGMLGALYDYYGLRPTRSAADDLQSLQTMRPRRRESALPQKQQQWAPRTTYAIVVAPASIANRGTPADPTRALPTLAQLHGVTVDLGLLPADNPARVFVFKFSPDGTTATPH
jgi:hypothetical protein